MVVAMLSGIDLTTLTLTPLQQTEYDLSW